MHAGIAITLRDGPETGRMQAATIPRDSDETVARVCWAALAAYADAARREPWPDWDRAADEARDHLLRRVCRFRSGIRLRRDALDAMTLEERRAWRLFESVCCAVTSTVRK